MTGAIIFLDSELTMSLDIFPNCDESIAPMSTIEAGERGFQRMVDARIREYAKRVANGSTDIFAERLPDSCYPTRQELKFGI